MTLYKPTPPDLGVTATIYKSDNRNYPSVAEHFHEFYELYYLKEGQRRYMLRDKIYRIGPGHLAAIPPFILHKTLPSPEYGGSFTKIQVLAAPPVVRRFSRTGALDPLEIFSERSYPLYKLSAKGQSLFERAVREIAELGDTPPADQLGESLYEALLLRISLLLWEGEIKPAGDIRPDGGDDFCQLILSRINSHYAEQETLDDLAALTGLHPKYMCSRFTRKMGFTIGNYRNLQRVGRVQELLETTEKPLEWIARETGFGGSSQMGRVFKSFRGISPSQWRRKTKG